MAYQIRLVSSLTCLLLVCEGVLGLWTGLALHDIEQTPTSWCMTESLPIQAAVACLAHPPTCLMCLPLICGPV